MPAFNSSPFLACKGGRAISGLVRFRRRLTLEPAIHENDPPIRIEGIARDSSDDICGAPDNPWTDYWRINSSQVLLARSALQRYGVFPNKHRDPKCISPVRSCFWRKCRILHKREYDWVLLRPQRVSRILDGTGGLSRCVIVDRSIFLESATRAQLLRNIRFLALKRQHLN